MNSTLKKSTGLDTPDSAGSVDELTIEQWLQIRKEEGRKIDPDTAEVDWCYAQVLDPYGVDPELPEEYRQVGREYFARSPGSDIWVCFGDLPSVTSEKLWNMHKSQLAFLVGLPCAEC